MIGKVIIKLSADPFEALQMQDQDYILVVEAAVFHFHLPEFPDVQLKLILPDVLHV